MDTVIITLRLPDARGRDLELPADVPLGLVLKELVNALELPPGDYHIARGGQPIQDQQTLQQANVMTGEILTLMSPHATSFAGAGAGFTQYSKSALLCTAAGRVIALDNFGRDQLLIGRFDPRTSDIVPEVDLSEEPDGLSVSRQHAWLKRRGDQWMIEAISKSSPTRVGKRLINPGESHALAPGDNITLGDLPLRFA